jgi:hypothetical protein
MRAAISAHPRIAIAPETHFLSYWTRPPAVREIRDAKDFERFWARFSRSRQFTQLHVPESEVRQRVFDARELSCRSVFASLLRAYAAAEGKPRWGEKTPLHHHHVGTLLEWFPEARILYMLRDPRSVVASLLDAPWAEPSIELQACRWRDSVRLLGHWESDSRICVVFYEALVSEPAEALRRIGHFLDESLDEGLLERRQVEPGEGASGHEDWARRHFQAASGPISTDSINRWQSRLSLEQVAIVEYLSQTQMHRVGYQPVTSGPGMEAWITLNARRGAHRLRRLVSRIQHRRPDLPASDQSA